MTVFDLTRTPEAITPPFGFIAMFLAIGLGLLAGSLFILKLRNFPGVGHDRIQNLAKFCAPFSVVWLLFSTWAAVTEIGHANSVRSSVRDGRYITLEGCLESFRPGEAMPGKSTSGNERWTVSGREFSYGAGQVTFGYHAVETRGGLVHADSRVRVSFVPDDGGRDEIVRLEVDQHACPAAPDLTGLPR